MLSSQVFIVLSQRLVLTRLIIFLGRHFDTGLGEPLLEEFVFLSERLCLLCNYLASVDSQGFEFFIELDYFVFVDVTSKEIKESEAYCLSISYLNSLIVNLISS